MSTALADLYKRDLYALCHDLLGYEDRLYEPLHRKVAHFLTNWEPDKFIKTLLIPRHHLKSTMASIGLPVWEWANDPEKKIMLVHGLDELVELYLGELKDKLNDPILPELFPDSFHKNPKDSGLWKTDKFRVKCKSDKTPSMMTASENASKTGTHYDLIILDDLCHEKNTKTVEALAKTKNFFANCIPQLRPSGRILVVGTRWDLDDLYGYLLDPDNPQSKHVDSLVMDCGWPGEPIFPLSKNGKAGFTQATLELKRAAMPDFQWSCQYMNNPLPATIKRFDRKDVVYYEPMIDGRPDIKDRMLYFTAVDPNRSLKTQHDPCVVMTVGRDCFGGHWVVDITRGHPTGPQMIEWIRSHVLRWSPDAVIIEASGYQLQIGEWCRKDMLETGVHYRIIAAERGPTSKIERVTRMEPLVQRGGLHVQAKHDSLVTELEYFPQWKNDDQVDCLADVYEYGRNPSLKASPKSGTGMRDELQFLESMRKSSGVVRALGSGVYRRFDP